MPISRDRFIERCVEYAIDPSKLYRSDELSNRVGWKPSGWRAARRAGLKATRYGKRWFVMGADFIAFIQANDTSDR